MTQHVDDVRPVGTVARPAPHVSGNGAPVRPAPLKPAPPRRAAPPTPAVTREQPAGSAYNREAREWYGFGGMTAALGLRSVNSYYALAAQRHAGGQADDG